MYIYSERFGTPGVSDVADWLLVALRAIHVVGAVFWAGSSFLFASYHEYIVDPGDAERTLSRMAAYGGMSDMVGFSGIISAAAGVILYWFVSDGLAMDWILSSYGLAITVGGVSAIAAIGVAIPTVASANDRAAALHEAYEDDGELTDEQAAEVQDLYHTVESGERWMSVLIAIAVVLMATAQYL